VNDAPVVVNDTGTTNRNTSVSLSVLANDSDVDTSGSALSITGMTQAMHGSVSIVGQNIEYMPNVGYCGSDSFSYQANDGVLNSTGIATVNITVNCTQESYA
jgi:hypothetical protein